MIKQAAKLLFFAVIFASCGSEKEEVQLHTLITGLENSNRVISEHNKELFDAFESKIRGPWHSSMTMSCFEKAKQINQFTAPLVDFLDVIDASLQGNSKPVFKQQATALYTNLHNYKLNLLNLLNDEEFPDRPWYCEEMRTQKEVFKQQMPVLAPSPDTVNIKPGITVMQSWLDSHFSDANSLMCRAQIQKIKSDVLITAQMVMKYFYSRRDVTICGFEQPVTISTLDSRLIRKGESIEVTAGVGVFSADTKPRIFIHGKQVNSDGDAITAYRFKPKGKPGKHVLQVQTELTMPDGTIMRHTKNLHYTIIE